MTTSITAITAMVLIFFGCQEARDVSQDAGGGAGGAGGAAAATGGATALPEHRLNRSSCSPGVQPTPSCVASGSFGIVFSDCSSSSDCHAGTNGRCLPRSNRPTDHISCKCAYDACSEDSDCSMGGPCLCGDTAALDGSGNTCLPGNCQVDADCGPQSVCSPSQGTAAIIQGKRRWTGYYCHSMRDLCFTDADCPPQGNYGSYCGYDATKSAWTCWAYMTS